MGENISTPVKLQFDRRVHLEFHGATITSDAGLLACRELDDALGLTETTTAYLQESRGGRNVQHQTCNTNCCPRSDNRYIAVLLAMRTPMMPNGWLRTLPCRSLLDGEALRDRQQALTP